jgi:hypothetical protein
MIETLAGCAASNAFPVCALPMPAIPKAIKNAEYKRAVFIRGFMSYALVGAVSNHREKTCPFSAVSK